MSKCWIAAVLAVSIGVSSRAAHAAPVNCYDKPGAACFETKPVTLPKTVDEFRKARDAAAKDPWLAATFVVQAMLVRRSDTALGDQMVVLTVSESHVIKSGDSYAVTGKAKVWIDRLAAQDHCLRSYVAGTSPDNGYELPEKLAFRFRKQDSYVGSIESGKFKVFLCSTGTDSCRPMTMTRNKNGIWKVDEMSSLGTGCRPAKPAADKEKDDAADAL